MIISSSRLEKALEASLASGADFAEIFVEDTYTHKLDWADQRIDSSLGGKNRGAGIRLFFGQEVVYVTTTDLSEEGLLAAAGQAAAYREGRLHSRSVSLKPLSYDSIFKVGTLPWDMSSTKKTEYLQRADRACRRTNSSISQVKASAKETVQNIQLANSEGLLAENSRHYSTLLVEAVAEDKGQKASGHERIGKMRSSEYFDEVDIENMAENCAKEALGNLKASYAPAGVMPVLLANGFGGVIFHEACGHGLETTSVAKNASVFCDRLNKPIANACVTAVDDGRIPNEWGSIDIDDEGAPSQTTTLIENGILRSYLVDRMGGLKMGLNPTGSARRESYKFSPTSRMRNTYIAPGNESLENMIRDIDYGLYAKKMGGGSVQPGTGAFNFGVREAYVIRNGELSERVKGVSLIGTGHEVLKKIVKVGNDLALAPGLCGSISGQVPVTVGQPSLLVEALTVGGRAQ